MPQTLVRCQRMNDGALDANLFIKRNGQDATNEQQNANERWPLDKMILILVYVKRAYVNYVFSCDKIESGIYYHNYA